MGSIRGCKIVPACSSSNSETWVPRRAEQAETQLFELGAVAIPVLEDALREKDLEIVFRAERILLRLNRQVP